jgi:putative membrane protein
VDLSFLPGVNAALNATAVVLLFVGRRLAREQRIDAHRRVMTAAFAVSSLFLVLYVAHKTSRGFVNTAFHAEGVALVAYRILLFTHVVLAMTVPMLAVALIVLGVSGRRESHRRLARIAWPIWVYVSVTGVLIYVLLYQLNPAPVESSSSSANRVGFRGDAGPRISCEFCRGLLPPRDSRLSPGHSAGVGSPWS